MEFEGKVVIVTGATSGIGMATARKFAAEGARVAATGRNAKVLATIEAKNIRTYQADLAGERETEQFAASVLRDFGGVDVLVNAAGIIAMGSIENTKLAD